MGEIEKRFRREGLGWSARQSCVAKYVHRGDQLLAGRGKTFSTGCHCKVPKLFFPGIIITYYILINELNMQSVTCFQNTSRILSKRVTPRVAMIPRRTPFRTAALFGGSKASPNSIYDIKIKTIDGKDESMSQFKGKVCVVVRGCGSRPSRHLDGSPQSWTCTYSITLVYLFYICRFFSSSMWPLNVALPPSIMTW